MSFLPKSTFKHNATARDPANADFLDDDIALLESFSAISEVDSPPHLCNPLSVSAPVGREKRTIIDASQGLNDFIVDQPIKIDHLQKVLSDLPHDAWFSLSDIMAGYYYILIAPEHRTLLGFQWEFSVGQTRLLNMACELPRDQVHGLPFLEGHAAHQGLFEVPWDPRLDLYR